MIIKLRFTAQLKDFAGVGIDKVELGKNEKLQSLLQKLTERYGDRFNDVLFDENGSYRNSNLIVINQTQVDFDENTLLKDRDEVTLMSPIAGG